MLAGAVAWALFVSVGCGPYELLTVLPTRADCHAVALTAWAWDLPWYNTAKIVCQPVDQPEPVAEPGGCFCC